MSAEAMVVEVGDAVLAGTVWAPPGPARASVLMWPGSGPSDRDNDGYFRSIREHLLANDIAVCSLDKRGVGASSGRWQDAGIIEQADDLLAALSQLGSHYGPATPVGLFGHSQGGWVVVEAAARRPPIAFAVANSGPGVSPREQERYALRARLTRGGAADVEIRRALHAFDAVAALLAKGVAFEQASVRLGELDVEAADLGELGLLLREPLEWRFVSRMIDYDPTPALARMRVPLLALFGSEDARVPVDASLAAYRAALPNGLLSARVFEGGDHRLQHGDPPRLVPDYLDALTTFIERALRP